MSEEAYNNLLALIRSKKVKIQTREFKGRPFLKSLWLQFACAYTRFRAVRDYDLFQETYKSEIIRLRLPEGGTVAHPEPWRRL